MKKTLALAIAVLASTGVASAQYSETEKLSNAEYFKQYTLGVVSYDQLPDAVQNAVLEINGQGGTEIAFRDIKGHDDVNNSTFSVGTDRNYLAHSNVSSTTAIYVPTNKRNDTVYGTKNTVKTARTDWTADSKVVDFYKMGLITYEDLPHYLQMNVLEINNEGMLNKNFGAYTSKNKGMYLPTMIKREVVTAQEDYEGQSVVEDADRITGKKQHMYNALGQQRTAMHEMKMGSKAGMQYQTVKTVQYQTADSFRVSRKHSRNEMADILRLEGDLS